MKKNIYSINQISQNDINYLLITLSEGNANDSFSIKTREGQAVDRLFEIKFCEEYMTWQEKNPDERMPWSESLISELHKQLDRFFNYQKAISNVIIKDIMSTDVISFKADETISDVVDCIIESKISGAPVISDDNSIIGVISEKDILNALFNTSGQDKNKDGHSLEISSLNKTVSSIMISKVIAADIDDNLPQTLALMNNNGFRRMPVEENGKLVGVISLGDVHRAIFKRCL